MRVAWDTGERQPMGTQCGVSTEAKEVTPCEAQHGEERGCVVGKPQETGWRESLRHVAENLQCGICFALNAGGVIQGL